MPAATYISATSFTVTGDQTSCFARGRRLFLDMGEDGNVEATVVSCIYQSGDDTTLVGVNVDDSIALTENLTTVEIGPTFSDEVNHRSNTGTHSHIDNLTGGYIPASGLTSSEVSKLKVFPVPQTGDANKLLQVKDDQSGYELSTLQGTTNRVTVTHGTQAITISSPQDTHTGASPTFVGATLTGLTGILEGKSSSPLEAHTGTALQVLRRNSGNTGYEFANVKLADLSDVDDEVETSKATGDLFYRDESTIKRLPIGQPDQLLSISSENIPQWVEAPESGGGSTNTEVILERAVESNVLVLRGLDGSDRKLKVGETVFTVGTNTEVSATVETVLGDETVTVTVTDVASFTVGSAIRVAATGITGFSDSAVFGLHRIASQDLQNNEFTFELDDPATASYSSELMSAQLVGITLVMDSSGWKIIYAGPDNGDLILSLGGLPRRDGTDVNGNLLVGWSYCDEDGVLTTPLRVASRFNEPVRVFRTTLLDVVHGSPYNDWESVQSNNLLLTIPTGWFLRASASIRLSLTGSLGTKVALSFVQVMGQNDETYMSPESRIYCPELGMELTSTCEVAATSQVHSLHEVTVAFARDDNVDGITLHEESEVTLTRIPIHEPFVVSQFPANDQE